MENVPLDLYNYIEVKKEFFKEWERHTPVNYKRVGWADCIRYETDYYGTIAFIDDKENRYYLKASSEK